MESNQRREHVSGVRAGQSEGGRMSFPYRTLPCSLRTQIPSVGCNTSGKEMVL